MVGRIQKDDGAPDPIDVGSFTPILLLVVARLDGPEAAILEDLGHVPMAQEDQGSELGDASGPCTGRDERRHGRVRGAEITIVEMERGEHFRSPTRARIGGARVS